MSKKKDREPSIVGATDKSQSPTMKENMQQLPGFIANVPAEKTTNKPHILVPTHTSTPMVQGRNQGDTTSGAFTTMREKRQGGYFDSIETEPDTYLDLSRGSSPSKGQLSELNDIVKGIVDVTNQVSNMNIEEEDSDEEKDEIRRSGRCRKPPSRLEIDPNTQTYEKVNSQERTD